MPFAKTGLITLLFFLTSVSVTVAQIDKGALVADKTTTAEITPAPGKTNSSVRGAIEKIPSLPS